MFVNVVLSPYYCHLITAAFSWNEVTYCSYMSWAVIRYHLSTKITNWRRVNEGRRRTSAEVQLSSACSFRRKRSWIIYCWLVWCERKILFQIIIHDRIREYADMLLRGMHDVPSLGSSHTLTLMITRTSSFNCLSHACPSHFFQSLA